MTDQIDDELPVGDEPESEQPQGRAARVEPPTNPGRAVKIKAAERRIMALELRKQGGSYRDIARTLKSKPGVSVKYSEGAAYKDVMDALAMLLDKQDELAEENLRLDLDRLDELLKTYWPLAKKFDIQALNAVISILDRRSKMLNYGKQDFLKNLNIDVTKLNDDQLSRLARGESILNVLATPNQSAS